MRFLFWRALIGLIAFDVFGFGRSFVRVHKLVGGWRIAQRTASAGTVDGVCKAVNCACVWYPRRVLCLQRSAVMTCLLRSCGVPAQMVIGAQKLPFKAHAWTEVSGCVIDERRDVQNIYGVWDRC